jgi:hypothetical protein
LIVQAFSERGEIGRPAHADEISVGRRGVASGVMRRAKNTPIDALNALKTMRLLPVMLAATLGAFGPAVGAACNEPTGCAEPVSVVASVEPAAASAFAQLAQIPGDVATPIASSDPTAATARVAALSDGRPTSALVMRPETVRAGARASTGERGRAEQRSPGGSEPSSVWLMLFAGLAFAGFVVAKRSRS